MQKVKWFSGSKESLSEIYQQTGMLFAFMSSPKDGGRACHPWVKCRDFMHDAVRAQITMGSCSIYGFNFLAGENPPIDLKKTRILVTKDKVSEMTEAQFKNKMKAALALVNHFEKYAGVSLSKLIKVDPTGSNKENVFLFLGPVMWMQSPFLVSMYTFLIRLGDKELTFKNPADLRKKFKALYDNNKKKASGGDNDAGYLGASWNKLHIIIKNRNKLFPKENGVHDIFFKGYDINSFHNRGGIRSLATAYTPDENLNKHIRELTE